MCYWKTWIFSATTSYFPNVKRGLPRLELCLGEGAEHYINFGEQAYMAATAQNREFDTDILRVSYQSMTTPPTTYDYQMQTRSFELLKQQEVLGGFEAKNYQSERHYATARDGVKVPISIVYRKRI